MKDYSDLAERTLEVTLKSGDEWMCRCPWHEDNTASLQFNVKKGLWVCFSCRRKGNAKTLFGQQWREPDADLDAVIAQLDLIDQAEKAPGRPTTVPESTLRRYGFPTTYWHDRGFTDDTIKAFQLGYDPIENEAIIPVRNMVGTLGGVIRRRLELDAHPKYLYYKGFPRKTSLFASWMVARTDTDHVVITEGALDAIKVWQAGHVAVAQYGSALSREQVILLRRLGITTVTMFYDNDRAGQEANLIATSLLRDFMLNVVRYDDYDPKDPGAASTKRIRQMVESARTVF